MIDEVIENLEKEKLKKIDSEIYNEEQYVFGYTDGFNVGLIRAKEILMKQAQENKVLYYPAIVHKENDVYWAEFPDFEAALTDGRTIDEVLHNAEDALSLVVDAMDELNRKLPDASDIVSLMKNLGTDEFVNMVRLEVEK